MKSLERGPDEEGIETRPLGEMPEPDRGLLERGPDEEGIETAAGRVGMPEEVVRTRT